MMKEKFLEYNYFSKILFIILNLMWKELKNIIILLINEIYNIKNEKLIL